MIAIIDYGAGNLFSVKNALDFLGLENKITNSAADLSAADRLILPGVGAFPDAMRMLGETGLIGVITCLLSAIGVKVGAMFGDRYRAPAERIGGIVLILIGVKTLLTGLGVL